MNVSGLAGITGNDQKPENWGPPGSRSPAASPAWPRAVRGPSTPTHAASTSIFTTAAATISPSAAASRLNRYDVVSQQDARGTFGFTGAATGSDLADFLLGLPHTSSIAFGNADKFLRGIGLRRLRQRRLARARRRSR